MFSFYFYSWYFYFIAINYFLFSECNIVSNQENIDVSVNDVAETLINVIGADSEETRIHELKEKLKKIDNYVVDKNKYALLLKNLTGETDLNATNFFTALYEMDQYQLLSGNESKNLYLKLKQKMNRDDIITILATQGNTSKLAKSARRAIGVDYIDRSDNYHEGDSLMLNTVVDEIIAELPKDEHTYDFKNNDGNVWDPQGELEDLRDYHQHDGRRIFKGERTSIKYYPFMVSVHVMGRFWCGGTLYWHDIVLTSAACLQLLHNNRFFRENPKVLKVRIGSNHTRIGGEMVEALEVYFHPSYDPRTLRNNIAIIRLRYHLFFNYHRIPKIITISHESGGVPSTAEVLLLGWGVKRLSQKLAYEPVFLQRKILPIYPNVFCKEVYGEKFITSSMFCAGTLTTGEGACSHDAGGPAILSGKLVGIISFGPSICGYPNAPTVFTLVGAFADWIETVNESMPTYYIGKKLTTTIRPEVSLQYFDINKYTHHHMKYWGLSYPTIRTTRNSSVSDTLPPMTLPPTTPHHHLRYGRPKPKHLHGRMPQSGFF